jgi:type II secretory pathway pseudopilin PulG
VVVRTESAEGLVTSACGLGPDQGQTLVELLVALGVTLVLSTSALGLLSAGTSAARVHPAATDVVERARAAVELVAADLAMAGAGIDVGSNAGFLGCCLPTVLPRRIGRLAADPVTVASDSRVTLVFAPFGALGGALAASVAGSSSALTLDPASPCGTRPTCGWADGATVLLSDQREHHDYYLLAASPGTLPALSVRQRSPGFTYAPGAMATAVETHTYYFDAAQRQLRHYDGHGSDVPAIDRVAGVTYAYFGDTAAPSQPKPPSGEANCVYDASGARWPTVGTLPGGVGNLVHLPLSSLADGPWCGSGDNRFDVDLLRIRRVRMVVRLEAPDDLRMSGALFSAPGSSRSARRLVPDLSLAVDIAPRNLNAGR